MSDTRTTELLETLVPVNHADLAAILAKLIAAPATEATLASILAKLIAAPATEAKQDTGNTTLADILAKLIAAPATEATLEAARALLAGTLTVQLTGSNAGAYESVTVANAAIGLTALTIAGYSKAKITVETAQLRYRIDGGNPTAAEGHIANIYDLIVLTSAADMVAFKAIRTGDTSAVIKCTYSE